MPIGYQDQDEDARLIKMLIDSEGLRLKPYRCPAGKLTIGVGRNLDDVGITEEEALILLENQLLEAKQDLACLFAAVWNWVTPARKHALIDMRFNLGPSAFREFKRLIAAVNDQKWQTAAAEALDSRWAAQVGRRAQRDALMLERGEWLS